MSEQEDFAAEVKRLRSIRIYRTDAGLWVWADHAGWGTGSFFTASQALTSALNGGAKDTTMAPPPPADLALLKRAVKGLETALHMIRKDAPSDELPNAMTPANRLRAMADSIDFQERKIAELCALHNELKEAST